MEEHSESGSSDSVPTEPIRQPEANRQQDSVERILTIGIQEIVTWLRCRLRFRGEQARVESDTNSQGCRTILRWLTQDLDIFTEKYRTLATTAEREVIHVLDAIGQGLDELLIECKLELFTSESEESRRSEIATELREMRKGLDLEKRRFPEEFFIGSLEDQKASSLASCSDGEFRQRFERCGNKILDFNVGRFIDGGTGIMHSDNPE